MQQAVQDLVSHGTFPRASTADVHAVQRLEKLLSDVRVPLSDEEAKALVKLFGPDDCFGLAWSLLHLIESAPSWPIADALQGESEWIDTLRQRCSLYLR